MLVTFIGNDMAGVGGAVRRMLRTAKGLGIAASGRPERREDLPPGHPPLLGMEQEREEYVIMTVPLHCSMEQVVDLLERDMPFGMSVVPVPSERCNVG